MSGSINISNEQLQTVACKAILDSITPEARAELRERGYCDEAAHFEELAVKAQELGGGSYLVNFPQMKTATGRQVATIACSSTLVAAYSYSRREPVAPPDVDIVLNGCAAVGVGLHVCPGDTIEFSYDWLLTFERD